jgi:hypothetical protein
VFWVALFFLKIQRGSQKYTNLNSMIKSRNKWGKTSN